MQTTESLGAMIPSSRSFLAPDLGIPHVVQAEKSRIFRERKAIDDPLSDRAAENDLVLSLVVIALVPVGARPHVQNVALFFAEKLRGVRVNLEQRRRLVHLCLGLRIE